ncbi:MAG: DUF2269 family protein [Dehalococcoidia bacterium]|nr:DUF2269 family protein [Dehalococcoidia bacterium]
MTGGVEWLLILHIASAIVGFAGAIPLPMVLATAARSNDLSVVRACLRLASKLNRGLATPGFVLAGIVGLILSLVQGWDFGENTWLNISATLWLVAIVVAIVAFEPVLKRAARLAAEAPGPGVPPELQAELRCPRGAIVGSILILLFVIVLILMVAKPGIDGAGIQDYPVAGFG